MKPHTVGWPVHVLYWLCNNRCYTTLESHRTWNTVGYPLCNESTSLMKCGRGVEGDAVCSLTSCTPYKLRARTRTLITHQVPVVFKIDHCLLLNVFYQRVSIASYANRWYSQRRNVRPSVCPSVTLRYCIKTKRASVIISSPSESLNILVSRNIWFITKFDRGHPERGRFLRLRWVRTCDFGDFSTNKPPYLRNGAR